MTNARKSLLAAIGFVLIAAVVAAVYLYQIEQQRRAEEALAFVEAGIAQYKQKQYETSLQILRGIPEGVIDDWRIPYYKGSALIRLKDYEAAVVSLEEALILNIEEEVIPFALGVAYFKLGSLSLSKSYFHTVLEINPNNADAKGLMDIMANLERSQPDASAFDSGADKSAPPENDAQPVDVTPSDEGQESTGN